jgi:hypothetical protein
MQKPKPAKKPAPKPPARGKRATHSAATTESAAVASSAPPPLTRTATPKPRATAPRRASARLHRSQLTAAGLRGRDLVRYLRIHAKRPYGDRGVRALVALAREVGHLGNVELNGIAAVREN